MDTRLETRFALASLKARMFGQEEPVRVGSYVLREFLGRGGMGDVYLAHDQRLGRDVALKLLGRRVLNRRREGDRLLKEARILAQLRHPNVITIHDVGRERDEVFLAMEYLDGGDLATWLAAELRPIPRIIEVLLAAGEGLLAAHRAGIVHRDFKPSNLLIDSEGHIRVVDFGVASLRSIANPEQLTVDKPQLATTVDLAGTPVYMAPEQHSGAPVDSRADQFAWCATLYQAVAGVEPFAADSYEELLAAKLAGRLVPPKRRVPARIMRVIRRGLEADPSRRYLSLREPMRLLARVLIPRWRTPGAQLGLVACVGVGLWFGVERPTPELCPSEQSLIDEHWSERDQLSVRTKLDAHSPQEGPQAWSWIEERLLGRITRWAELERQLCESNVTATARERARVSPRDVCQRRWATVVDEAVAVLKRGDFEHIWGAIGIVEQLPDPAACARQNTTGLSPLFGDVTGDEERDQIMDFLEALDRARTLRRDSELEQAIDDLKPLIDVATAHGWIAARAEAEVELGRILVALERDEEATQALRDGIVSAVRSGHLYVEAHARIKLVQALGEYQANFQPAEIERRYAEATVDRLGDPIMRAEYELAVAGVAWRRDETVPAAEHVERALALFGERLGDDSLRYAFATIYLGAILRRTDPSRAEAALRHGLTVLTRELDELHPRRINVLTDLSETVSLQGRQEEALELMREALALLERQEPSRRRPASLMTAHFRMGGLLSEGADLSAAVDHFQAAYSLAKEHFGDEQISTYSVRLMLGATVSEVASQAENGDGARERLFATAQRHLVAASAGLDRALGSSHPDSMLARLYLGQLRVRQDEAEAARELLESCLSSETEGHADSLVAADVAVQSRILLAELIWEEEPQRARALSLEAWERVETLIDPETREERGREAAALLCEHEIGAPGLQCPDRADVDGG